MAIISPGMCASIGCFQLPGYFSLSTTAQRSKSVLLLFAAGLAELIIESTTKEPRRTVATDCAVICRRIAKYIFRIRKIDLEPHATLERLASSVEMNVSLRKFSNRFFFWKPSHKNVLSESIVRMKICVHLGPLSILSASLGSVVEISDFGQPRRKRFNRSKGPINDVKRYHWRELEWGCV
jgi:hypothetical protein